MEETVLMEGIRGMLLEGVVVVGEMSMGTRMTNDEGIKTTTTLMKGARRFTSVKKEKKICIFGEK